MVQKKNKTACLALTLFSVTSPTGHKWIAPFLCWFLGGWVRVHYRTLWVSPTNSPVRLGVFSTTATPTGSYGQRFWGFSFPCWNPGLCGLSHSLVVPPGLSTHKCGTTLSLQLLPCFLSSLPQLPVFTPPTGLNECFFFNSLVIRLPYSSIFWQFWLFLIFKFLLSLFWLYEEAKHIYLCLYLGQRSK